MAKRSPTVDRESNGWRPLERPATLDHLRKSKKPVYLDVPIVLDSALADEFNEATGELQAAKARLTAAENANTAHMTSLLRVGAKTADAPLPWGEDKLAKLLRAVQEAEERLEIAREAVEPVVVNIRVKSLPEHVLDALRDDHQPTDEQIAEHKAQWDAAMAALPEDDQAKMQGRYSPLDVNPDSYPAALLAACCVSPAMTYDDAYGLLHDENYNEAEIASIIHACKAVQLARPQVDLGKGYGRKPGSA